jgi:hypothetical protein
MLLNFPLLTQEKRKQAVIRDRRMVDRYFVMVGLFDYTMIALKGLVNLLAWVLGLIAKCLDYWQADGTIGRAMGLLAS